MAFVDSVKRGMVRLRARTTERQRAAVRNQLSALIVTLSQVTDLEIREFGCGVFLLQRRWLRRPERLVRRDLRVRLIDELHESPVEYTKDKGTVGECWSRCSSAHHVWSSINWDWADQTIPAQQYETLPDSIRRGFTLDEFHSLVGKYSEVLAVPITHGPTFIGCLAVDLRWHREQPDPVSEPRLKQPAVMIAVEATARTIVPALTG